VSELPAFITIVAVVTVLGVTLGMLVAPRLTRLSERDDEESGDDEPG
jgi:hypothetical protein